MTPGSNAKAGPPGPSDEALAVRSREGDLAAFEVLARRFENRLYSYALGMIGDRHEAADQAQEVLVRAFRSLGRFDARRSFASWVFGIAAHVCRDWLRRRHRRRERPSEAVEDASSPAQAAARAEAEETRQRVRAAVRKLPPKYREVIVLHYLEEMSYDQVGESLGITAPAARRRALRAREMLRRTLGDEDTG